MTFQRLLATLNEFWEEQGCLVSQAYDVEMGAGTMAPDTFFRALGPEPWNVAYVQASRRPTDGRYGENPNRFQRYFQHQVIMKPSPADIQERYLLSLERLGVRPQEHDIRFVEDEWDAPTLGASGVGWEVRLDGEEITQFTYFQQVGGLECKPISVEITYGPERLAMLLQGVSDYRQLMWSDDITYGELRYQEEFEMSRYNFEEADIEMLLGSFAAYEREARRALEKGLAIPAYDYVLKCSHAFNILDARGGVSVTERAHYIGRVRRLARQAAQAYIAVREAEGFPLLRGEQEAA